MLSADCQVLHVWCHVLSAKSSLPNVKRSVLHVNRKVVSFIVKGVGAECQRLSIQRSYRNLIKNLWKIVSKFDHKSMENRTKKDPKIDLGGVLGGSGGVLGSQKSA